MCWDGTFLKALHDAIPKVDERYFTLDRVNALPVQRERAYSYELYHHIRIALDRECPEFPYTLHGEVDKRGHGEVCDRLKLGRRCAPNPDFVVHMPGDNDNLAAIEVKCSIARMPQFRKDIYNLARFVHRLGYRHGILLVFGEAPPPITAKTARRALMNSALRVVDEYAEAWLSDDQRLAKAQDIVDKIAVLHHKAAGGQACQISDKP